MTERRIVVDDGTVTNICEGLDITEGVKVILDALAGSIDAGSGFLDHAEVAAMRAVAEAVGSDPNDVTPDDWACAECKHALACHEAGCKCHLRLRKDVPLPPVCAGFVFVVVGDNA